MSQFPILQTHGSPTTPHGITGVDDPRSSCTHIGSLYWPGTIRCPIINPDRCRLVEQYFADVWHLISSDDRTVLENSLDFLNLFTVSVQHPPSAAHESVSVTLDRDNTEFWTQVQKEWTDGFNALTVEEQSSEMEWLCHTALVLSIEAAIELMKDVLERDRIATIEPTGCTCGELLSGQSGWSSHLYNTGQFNEPAAAQKAILNDWIREDMTDEVAGS